VSIPSLLYSSEGRVCRTANVGVFVLERIGVPQGWRGDGNVLALFPRGPSGLHTLLSMDFAPTSPLPIVLPRQ